MALLSYRGIDKIGGEQEGGGEENGSIQSFPVSRGGRNAEGDNRYLIALRDLVSPRLESGGTRSAGSRPIWNSVMRTIPLWV